MINTPATASDDTHTHATANHLQAPNICFWCVVRERRIKRTTRHWFRNGYVCVDVVRFVWRVRYQRSKSMSCVGVYQAWHWSNTPYLSAFLAVAICFLFFPVAFCSVGVVIPFAVQFFLWFYSSAFTLFPFMLSYYIQYIAYSEEISPCRLSLPLLSGVPLCARGCKVCLLRSNWFMARIVRRWHYHITHETCPRARSHHPRHPQLSFPYQPMPEGK